MSDGTNVAVGAESVIEVRGQAPSFDDLEAISAPKPGKEAKEPIPSGKQKAETVDKKETVRDSGTNKPKAKSEDGGAEEDSGADDEADLEDKAAKPKEKERGAEGKPGTKYIKAKHNDAELELATDTIVPTKVAGTLENPTLAELQANYSGKVNWDRQYGQLNKERSEFNASVSQLNTTIEKMLSESKEEPFRLFDVIAEATGADPVELKMQAIEQQIALTEKIRAMSPEQLQSWKREMRLQFKEETVNRRDRIYKDAENAKLAEAKLSETRDKYSITPEAYKEAEQVARQYIKDRELTPDDVVRVDRHLMIQRAVEEVNPEVAELVASGDKQAVAKVNWIHQQAMETPEYTADDLKELITAAFEKAPRQRRLAQHVARASEHGDTARKPTPERRELYSFDQLD